jgi:UDP-GlcNAc:undecaprenyl-phosphate/decaprenyl-phosphate GlcNAc-1-phosphate transferase
VDTPLAAVAAFLVALVATPLAIRAAVRFRVLDRPGALKVHERPVPYLGGVAVFAGVAVVLVPTRPSWLVPLAMALVLGVADDATEINAWFRLSCEIAIGLVAGAFVPAPVFAGGLVTAVMVVALVNAINLLDGLDGLATGVSLVSAAGFALLGGEGRALALALVGALAAFLLFNRPPARIYLGDGGAYLLGTALAMVAAAALREGEALVAWPVIGLLVGVPLSDTLIAIVRRVRAHRPLFTGDRSHVYDQLVDRGRTRGEAAAACIALQAALVVVGVVAWHLPAVAAVLAGALVAAAIAVSAIAFGFLSTSGAT